MAKCNLEITHWLMKTEPSVFSFEDLIKAPKRTTSWEGIRNYQARNFLRDAFKKGHRVLVYHSNTDEPAVVGVAEVAIEGYPDNFALDPTSDYFDAAAKKKGASPWVMVDIRATHRLQTPVTRERLKQEKSLQKMMVLQKGSRLSVQPVTEVEFDRILVLGGAMPI